MNSRLKSILLNPFMHTAGLKAFTIGIAIVAATAIVGYFSNTVFPGVISVKISAQTLGSAFLIQAVGLAATILYLYLSASVLTRNIRFSDFLGTVTLARYPFIFAAIPGFFVTVVSTDEILGSFSDGTFHLSDIGGLLTAGLIMMVFAVWSVVLLFNAYRTSSGLKGPRLSWSFAVSVVAAEIISGLVTYRVYA